jgi:protein-tyrosine-phosphatase
MKVLFVCRGNVGRSQMAATLFEKFTGMKADSAGIKVLEKENVTLSETRFTEPVIRFMLKEGFDVSENPRRQLTPKMIKDHDKVVVLAEKEVIPDFLKEAKNAVFWEIEDPKGMDDDGYLRVISKIKENLKRFLSENNIKQKV